jgi:SNF2 family DNA or RNA helicase
MKVKSRDDLSSEQRKCVQFIGAGEDALIAADVGTGKTVIALTAARDALCDRSVSRWLILAPLLVATDTWALEPDQWEHLDARDLAVACGSVEQRRAAIESGAPCVVMNYENLQWLLDQYPRPRRGQTDTLPFDGLICDEIDKLKDVSSKRFKAVRARLGVFKKRIGLTGTLIPNKLTELWGQVYMVDNGESFGRSFYKWRQKYFYPIDYQQYKWVPFPHTPGQLISQMQGMVFRIRARGLPEICLVEPELIDLPKEVQHDYRTLARDFFLLFDDDDDDEQVDAANAAVLSGKLQQICAGFSYLKDKPCTAENAFWHTDYKYRHWLPQLLGEHQLLIIYNFRAELEKLQEIHPDIPHIGGGVTNKKARELIAAFNAGSLQSLALHPASAGHGINLQHNNANHIAFLTLPWSGGLYHQVVGRLARRGNREPLVYVHTCLFRDTIDQDVFDALTMKINAMTKFLHALET